MFTARYELIEEVNFNTVHHGFSNSGARATTGTPITVYWHTAYFKKSKFKKNINLKS